MSLPYYGNNLVDGIREINVTCKRCEAGEMYMSKLALANHLEDLRVLRKWGWKSLMAVYREWKRNDGWIVCPDCCGNYERDIQI